MISVSSINPFDVRTTRLAAALVAVFIGNLHLLAVQAADTIYVPVGQTENFDTGISNFDFSSVKGDPTDNTVCQMPFAPFKNAGGNYSLALKGVQLGVTNLTLLKPMGSGVEPVSYRVCVTLDVTRIQRIVEKFNSVPHQVNKITFDFSPDKDVVKLGGWVQSQATMEELLRMLKSPGVPPDAIINQVGVSCTCASACVVATTCNRCRRCR